MVVSGDSLFLGSYGIVRIGICRLHGPTGWRQGFGEKTVQIRKVFAHGPCLTGGRKEKAQ